MVIFLGDFHAHLCNLRTLIVGWYSLILAQHNHPTTPAYEVDPTRPKHIPLQLDPGRPHWWPAFSPEQQIYLQHHHTKHQHAPVLCIQPTPVHVDLLAVWCKTSSLYCQLQKDTSWPCTTGHQWHRCEEGKQHKFPGSEDHRRRPWTLVVTAIPKTAQWRLHFLCQLKVSFPPLHPPSLCSIETPLKAFWPPASLSGMGTARFLTVRTWTWT